MNIYLNRGKGQYVLVAKIIIEINSFKKLFCSEVCVLSRVKPEQIMKYPTTTTTMMMMIMLMMMVILLLLMIIIMIIIIMIIIIILIIMIIIMTIR